MQQPIKNGVCQGRLADVVVPMLGRQLAGDQGGAPTVPVLDHLHQILPLGGGDFLYAPVVEDQQVHLEQPVH